MELIVGINFSRELVYLLNVFKVTMIGRNNTNRKIISTLIKTDVASSTTVTSFSVKPFDIICGMRNNPNKDNFLYVRFKLGFALARRVDLHTVTKGVKAYNVIFLYQ